MREPRIGFVGLGWIGSLRLKAVASAGGAEVAALCDADERRLQDAAGRFPAARAYRGAGALLEDASELGLDGAVLATPNALHAPQALRALEEGLALFVQKPLGLHRAEVEEVLARAGAADRLVEVDYCYREVQGARHLRRLVRAGELGEVFLVEACFHNAYGPDKAWCFEPEISGGGALLDLGVHLIDLTFWIFGTRRWEGLRSRVRGLDGRPGIDQFVTAEMELDGGPRVRLGASWHAHTGRDCEFRYTVHGSAGGAELRNVGGSFYDFELGIRKGREERVRARDRRSWMDRRIVDWTRRLRGPARYDAAAETNLSVASLADAIYDGRRAGAAPRDAYAPTAARSSSPLQKASGLGRQR